MEEAELYFKIQNIGYIVGWIIMGILLIWGIVITLIERKKQIIGRKIIQRAEYILW